MDNLKTQFFTRLNGKYKWAREHKMWRDVELSASRSYKCGNFSSAAGLSGAPTSSTIFSIMPLLSHLVPTSMLLLIGILLIPDPGVSMVLPAIAGTCPPDTQMCLDGSQCYGKALHCDGNEDCDDGTDEFECNNEVTDECIDKLTCKDGNGCFEQNQVCDKVEDCSDGSDESNCTTECDDVYHFHCLNGKCITIELQCNNIDDCGDMSDEQSCTKIEMNCTEDEFVCPDGTCLSSYRVCDGYPNCHDGSDERVPCNIPMTTTNVEPTVATIAPTADVEVMNTTTKSVSQVCSEHDFQCLSGECIPYNKVCNKEADCADRSDEQDCTLPEHKDSCEDGFSCANGHCIPKEWTCDGVNDCEDNGDEDHCPPTDARNRLPRQPISDRIFELKYEILKQERAQQEHLYQLKIRELELKIETANVELDAAKKWRTAAWDKVDQQTEIHRLTVATILKNVTTHEIYNVDPVLQNTTYA